MFKQVLKVLKTTYNFHGKDVFTTYQSFFYIENTKFV